MKVEVFSREAWSSFSETAHSLVFEKVKPAEWDRIDYALLAVDDEDPVGYITVRELDPKTVYWQFGGMFPPYRKSLKAVRSYQACLDFEKLQKDRQYILTYIDRNNIEMLRLAMSVGFRISGIRVAGDSILVEHVLDFKKES